MNNWVMNSSQRYQAAGIMHFLAHFAALLGSRTGLAQSLQILQQLIAAETPIYAGELPPQSSLLLSERGVHTPDGVWCLHAAHDKAGHAKMIELITPFLGLRRLGVAKGVNGSNPLYAITLDSAGRPITHPNPMATSADYQRVWHYIKTERSQQVLYGDRGTVRTEWEDVQPDHRMIAAVVTNRIRNDGRVQEALEELKNFQAEQRAREAQEDAASRTRQALRGSNPRKAGSAIPLAVS